MLIRNDHAIQVAAGTNITNFGPGSIKIGALSEIASSTARTIVTGGAYLTPSSVYVISLSTSEVQFASQPSLPFVSLAPSGDLTGLEDAAAINGILATPGINLELKGNYVTNVPIEINSDSTLLLSDARIQLASLSSCNIIRNKNWNQTTQTDKRIRIIGTGRAQLIAIVGSSLNQASTPAPQTTLILNDVL